LHLEKGEQFMSTHAFTFGIYPGGITGTEVGDAAYGPADEPAKIKAALDTLQGKARAFLVRAYRPFHDSPEARTLAKNTPEQPDQYLRNGRQLDLVVQFQSKQGDVDAFVEFARRMVREYGSISSCIQITEEANVTLNGLDGMFPNVCDALVRGVIAAKEEARRQGYAQLQIGFNATPSFDPSHGFWQDIGARGGARFVEALDYVGLDFFPDVFRPVAPDGEPGDLRQMVFLVLQAMRDAWLPAAGIPASVPIHITENGWPTSPIRSARRQAESLEIIVRAIYEHRARLNVTHYEHFDLRDADSAQPNIFYQFGLLHDDYTPKPAFETYRRLIAELSAEP
jgi:hypothetical protein